MITGRGGLPTHPAAPLGASTVWHDLAPIPVLENSSAEDEAIAPPQAPPMTPDASPVEAKSWTRTEAGTVVLLADGTAAPDYFVPTDCAGN